MINVKNLPQFTFSNLVNHFLESNGYNGEAKALLKTFDNVKFGIYPLLDMNLTRVNAYDLEEFLEELSRELSLDQAVFVKKIANYIYHHAN